MLFTACLTLSFLSAENGYADSSGQAAGSSALPDTARAYCFKDHILYTDINEYSRDHRDRLCTVGGAEFFLAFEPLDSIAQRGLTNQTFEVVRGSAEQMVIGQASTTGISRVGWLRDGKTRFSYGPFTYYLYDHGKGSYKFIRCSDGHPEGIACVSYFPDIGRYTTFIGEESLRIRLTFPLAEIESFPTYYNLALEIIEKTDFAAIIECNDERYICKGKTDELQSP
jgi:hypothetical protein